MRFSLFPLTTSFLVYFFCLHLSLHPPLFFHFTFPPLLGSPSPAPSFLASLLFSASSFFLLTFLHFTPPSFYWSLPPLYPFFLLVAPSLPPFPALRPLFTTLFLLVAPSLPPFPALRPLFTPFSCSFPHLYPLFLLVEPLYPLFLLFAPSLPPWLR